MARLGFEDIQWRGGLLARFAQSYQVPAGWTIFPVHRNRIMRTVQHPQNMRRVSDCGVSREVWAMQN
jgi:hypothetical protein